MAMLGLGNPCSADGRLYGVHSDSQIVINAVEIIGRGKFSDALAYLRALAREMIENPLGAAGVPEFSVISFG